MFELKVKFCAGGAGVGTVEDDDLEMSVIADLVVIHSHKTLKFDNQRRVEADFVHFDVEGLEGGAEGVGLEDEGGGVHEGVVDGRVEGEAGAGEAKGLVG